MILIIAAGIIATILSILIDKFKYEPEKFIAAIMCVLTILMSLLVLQYVQNERDKNLVLSKYSRYKILNIKEGNYVIIKKEDPWTSDIKVVKINKVIEVLSE